MARKPDQFQQLSTAGLVPKGSNDNAQQCMRPDIFPVGRAETPEHIRKYRKSFRNEPGIRMVHPGLVEHVENLDRNRTYGKQTQGSENINGVIKAQNLVGMSEKFHLIKEAKYQSHKREPLGQGLTRDYQMPVQTKNPDFRFGVSSSQCDNAKDLIAP